MPSQTDSSKKTRQRVLESACEVFAEKGFHDATVQDICDRAGANIASVNYYFGDKETLYAEAWQHAQALAREAYPLPNVDAKGIAPEERLHQLVSSALGCIFDEGLPGCLPRLMLREMLKPSPALEELVLGALSPRVHIAHDVVRELLGPGADQRLVHSCTMRVVSQYAFLNFSRPIREIMHRHHVEEHGEHEEPTVRELARHITEFSLAGIRHCREAAAQ